MPNWFKATSEIAEMVNPLPFMATEKKKKKKKKRFTKSVGTNDLAVSQLVFSAVGNKQNNVVLGRPEQVAEGMAVEMANEIPDEDNIVAAMDSVMKSEPLTRKANTNSEPGKPATKQFLLRLTPDEHENWKASAESRGVSVAELVREAVREYLANHPKEGGPCTHPAEYRVRYPWAEICKKCKKRF